MAVSPENNPRRPASRHFQSDAQSTKSRKSVHRLSLRRIFGRGGGDESKRNSVSEPVPPLPPLPPAGGTNGVNGESEGAAVKEASVRPGNGAVNGASGGGKRKKKFIMSAFVEMCSGHQSPGLWRHPDDESHRFNDVKHWMALAKMLEAGKFHCIFIADVLGGYDVYGGPRNLEPAIRSGAQWPVNEPLSVVPAMAAVTESISFGVTVSTTYEQPYHLARRLSTVDHLTDGRVGWNVVTGYLDSAARNLGRTEQPDHDERYQICDEYMSVMYKLWQSSWRDGAVVRNRKQAVYTHPDRVREINHKGKYFEVPGPHICQPSPQRTPVIMQAGTSKAGKEFAARHAEAIFVSGHSPPAVAKNIRDIREQAAKEGRDPQSIKFLAKICPILGRTREEAEAKFQEYLSYGSEEGALALFGGWTGVDMAQYGEDEELRYVESNAIRSYIEGLMKTLPKAGKWTKKSLAEHIIVGGLGATPVGTPSEVADEFERWVEEADVDGFNIAYAVMPQTFTDVIELLLPELRRRGLFWDDYTVHQGTYRENLHGQPGQEYPLPDHPASKYLWRAGESKDTPIYRAEADDTPRASQQDTRTPAPVQTSRPQSQPQPSSVPKYQAAAPPPPGFVPGPVPGAWVRSDSAVPSAQDYEQLSATRNGTNFSSLNAVAAVNGTSINAARAPRTAPQCGSAPRQQPYNSSFSLGPAWARIRDDAQPDSPANPYAARGPSSQHDEAEERFYDVEQDAAAARGPAAATAQARGKARTHSPEVDDLMARIMEHGVDSVIAENGYIDPTAAQFA